MYLTVGNGVFRRRLAELTEFTGICLLPFEACMLGLELVYIVFPEIVFRLFIAWHIALQLRQQFVV